MGYQDNEQWHIQHDIEIKKEPSESGDATGFIVFLIIIVLLGLLFG